MTRVMPLAGPDMARRPAFAVSPRSWGRSMSAPPVLNNHNGAWSGAPIRWWRDVSPDIAQPALDHHYLTMHLGGAKRIKRRGEGKVEAIDIESGALSIVPAGSAFQWSTRGPIEFAHLYVAPGTRVRQIAAGR